ncbi:S-adenosyl-L-methionine-dependent tRNA 4-demethylwyosine synthase TYW1-like [Halichondria panicea]|uniref:S-adenosyl-L-methionine-dependent tRNA 4-demethylwyosine synthase TYW1-like n=1 Tax=Halichondria panicea TaxID=6063 RepID=UPI00312B3993
MESSILQYALGSPLSLGLTLLLVVAATVLVYLTYNSTKSSNQQGKDKVRAETLHSSTARPPHSSTASDPLPPHPHTLKVFYGTQAGTSKSFAEQLVEKASSRGVSVTIADLKDCDPDDTLTHECCDPHVVCVFLLSTYTGGAPPDTAEWFCRWIHEASDDCRVQKSLLAGVKFTVFALGHSLYDTNYCLAGKNLFDWLRKLSAKPVYPLRLGDQNVAQSDHGGLEEDFKVWLDDFVREVFPVLVGERALQDLTPCDGGHTPCECGGGKSEGNCCKSSKEEVLYESSSEDEASGAEEEAEGGSPRSSVGLVDVEDMGHVMGKMKSAKSQRREEEDQVRKGLKEPREMVTPALRQSLTKQGYRVVGSHSGVKMCRWTKSMLRGRGGCYKHTFYGIESHRCMETTPSLACANKCVFCWRHHTNPVGTEWRWKMDDAETILKGALDSHYQMVKQFKGVPGVLPRRLAEGKEPKHCALSLVGEPIMYPEINTLVRLLHNKEISTFLVTNAQFPEAIRSLLPVTQLYVSVDASTKDTLKKIDRPLFRDFWPRFISSLEALSEKGQRTVYRLTLVKQWNTDELESYASLVTKGNPDFIEVKGVTYCGDSKTSTLTLVNVPWHEEVLNFVQTFAALLPDYAVACEHEHSNCVLIAHKKFFIDGKWHTWIDYTKFHELIGAYEASNGQQTFTALDYVAPSPEWAVIGHKQRGFDPLETRWHRKNKNKDIGGC